MFLRVVRAAGGHGVTHEYVRVVEAFREDGKTRHRTARLVGVGSGTVQRVRRALPEAPLP